MKKLIFIAMVLSGIVFQSNDSFAQFRSQQQSLRSLFSDVKAFQVDDAIMVLIVEDTQADNGANTSSGRSSSLGAGVDVSTSSSNTKINAGINTDNSFKGTGSTNRNETIRSKMSVRVTEVQPNGNLSIEGKRTTKINKETQTITIKGIVRPVDVQSDNSVYSYSILDLTLLIEGEGSVTETQEPGLITKFLRLLF